MTYDDVLSFVKEYPESFIATVDGGQPRVRGFLAIVFEDGRIYYTTGANKAVYKQLRENPRVELCFYSKDPFRMLRIVGDMETVDDRAKKQKLVDERDYLKVQGIKADDPNFILLRLPHGKARFWTMEYNMREDELEIIEF